jgi:UPF0176 protein
MQVLNVSAYKFVSIEHPAELRLILKERADGLGLRGTVLLAHEGINLFLAGAEANVRAFLSDLGADDRFAGIPTKLSWAAEQPFNRMLVKVKREIIPLRQPEIDPSRDPAPRLSPEELKTWLDQGRDVLLVDTRNDFEVELGTFRGARNLHLSSFAEFPAKAEALEAEWQDRPVVTFCTGGIRCEKAAPLLARRGFSRVYQLEGGILSYFERCGGAHFDGECFVFDKRVALGADLKPTGTAQCYACQAVLTPGEQAAPEYAVGVSCPRCIGARLAA